MFFTKIYYTLKPFIPFAIRMGLRRRLATRARIANADIWPIDEKAGFPPPNWPGWPEKKQFAVVLTHDVEGSKGFSRVERLMELERCRGFRSSFNFVPEGQYRVPDELPERMNRAGFEVGIHGLHHDGKLYSSKAVFAARAASIREYAQRWKASGFRSPFMQHKLAWLHELNLAYDASTFDTDPFEPQPDPAETIFPFWVPGVNGKGYVELPYTLVQDFSLFVILRDRNIDMWKRKLDWVAARGGMVLLNTHPDYMCFEGTPQRDEFPVSYYDELLRYINDNYAGSFWGALPRDVARYYCDNVPVSRRNTRKKICMVAYSSYETDNRVRRYAESLSARGDQVDVIAVAGGDVPLGTEVIKGVTVHRIQGRRDRNERTTLDFAGRLLRFLWKSGVFVARRHYRKRYDVVHIHNIPDFLVYAGWYPKCTGAKVILDIHDIVPELYASKFKTDLSDRRVALLKYIEKKSTAFADHVIVSNDLWSQKLIARSVPKEKTSVILNHVDQSIFYSHPRTRHDDRFVVLFPGSFQWHQGLDLAIEAIGRIRGKVPNVEFHIYGGGHEAAALAGLSSTLNLDGVVKFCGSVPLDQMPNVIANADLGVVPKRANSFGNEAYSTKIMEFMSQGVPVVLSRTKIDSFYFDDTSVRFFESGDIQALADAMLELIEHPEVRESLIVAGYEYVDRHGWNTKKSDYFDLVDSLTVESFSAYRTPTSVPVMSGQPGL
jgi:glycosyltransferase involved in cell wall biosynthesis